MNLFKLCKKSFTTVFSNPFVTIFLVLFLIISNFILSYAFVSKNVIIVTLVSLCALLLTFAFVSGWFYVVKDIVVNDDKQDKNYFPIFFEGVGKNIIPVGIASMIYSGLLFVLLFVTGKICMHFFGNLDFLFQDLMAMSQANTNFVEFLSKLTLEQKYALYAWQMSFALVGVLYNYIMLFYFPTIIFQEEGNAFKKPFVSLFNSVKFLFKNFLSATGLYLLIYITYMLFGILKHFFVVNPVLIFLFLIIYIYFICTVIMLIFNYYAQKNNYINGSDSIGQDENIDKSCEEN